MRQWSILKKDFLCRVYSCRFEGFTSRSDIWNFLLLTGKCCTPFPWRGQLYQRQIGMNKNWRTDKNSVFINLTQSFKKKNLATYNVPQFQIVQSFHILKKKKNPHDNLEEEKHGFLLWCKWGNWDPKKWVLLISSSYLYEILLDHPASHLHE